MLSSVDMSQQLKARGTLHGGLSGSLEGHASLGDPPVKPPVPPPDNFGRVARIMEIVNDAAEFAKTVWEAIGPYVEPLLFQRGKPGGESRVRAGC